MLQLKASPAAVALHGLGSRRWAEPLEKPLQRKGCLSSEIPAGLVGPSSRPPVTLVKHADCGFATVEVLWGCVWKGWRRETGVPSHSTSQSKAR